MWTYCLRAKVTRDSKTALLTHIGKRHKVIREAIPLQKRTMICTCINQLMLHRNWLPRNGTYYNWLHINATWNWLHRNWLHRNWLHRNWHLSSIVSQVLHCGWIHLAAHLGIVIWTFFYRSTLNILCNNQNHNHNPPWIFSSTTTTTIHHPTFFATILEHFVQQCNFLPPSPSWSASLSLWEDRGRGQGEGRPTISLPLVWLEDMGSKCHLSGANMKYGWPLLVSWQCWSLFDEMELFLSGSLMAATCVKPYWEQKNIVRRKTQKWEHTFALFLLCIMCKNLSDYNHLKYIKKSNEADKRKPPWQRPLL